MFDLFAPRQPRPLIRRPILLGLDSLSQQILASLDWIMELHMLLFGASGSGKTVLLASILDQILRFRPEDRVSIFCLDLKASDELLPALIAAGIRLANQRYPNTLYPAWFLSNRHATQNANFMESEWWSTRSPAVQANIILSALGLIYDRSYGAAFYTDLDFFLIHFVFKRERNIRSFAELVEKINWHLEHASPSDLPGEVKRSGLHVRLALDRLQDTPFFQPSQPGQEQNVLDFTELFRKPTVVFAGLNSLENELSAGEMARVLLSALIIAGNSLSRSERKTKVLIIADESLVLFGGSPHVLDKLIALARSLGAGWVFTCQEAGSLQNAKLLDVLEGNTGTRIWCAAADRFTQKQIAELGGKIPRTLHDHSVTFGPNGRSVTNSQRTVFEDRFPPELCQLLSSRPDLFLLQASWHASGVPVLAQRGHFQSKEEHDSLAAAGWPLNRTESEGQSALANPPSEQERPSEQQRRPPRGRRGLLED